MPNFRSESAPLERYGHNLTVLAQQGAFPPLAGQEVAVRNVLQVLQRKNKCNPLILDVDETRRWAVVAEVIRRMAVGDVPDLFPTRQVIALDYEALFADLPDDTLIYQERRKQMLSPLFVKMAPVEQESTEEWWARVGKAPFWPELEEWLAPTMVLERLQSMFTAMHQAEGSFLLFVDRFHRLLGGEWDRYPIDAVALLKPALARRQTQLIGACTREQYRQYIERDAAISRRCQEICLPEAW